MTKLTNPLVADVMTTEQAARYLQVSAQFLEIARSRGGGPRFSKLGRAIRYRREALDQWLIENEVANTAQPPGGTHD